MNATFDAAKLNRYLVELTPPANGFEDIQLLSDRSRAACLELTRQNNPVRLLRTVFVPEDGTCLLLVEARSARAAATAAAGVDRPVGRVSKVVVAGRGGGSGGSK